MYTAEARRSPIHPIVRYSTVQYSTVVRLDYMNGVPMSCLVVEVSSRVSKWW